jgi:hypothetical protein
MLRKLRHFLDGPTEKSAHETKSRTNLPASSHH